MLCKQNCRYCIGVRRCEGQHGGGSGGGLGRRLWRRARTVARVEGSDGGSGGIVAVLVVILYGKFEGQNPVSKCEMHGKASYKVQCA